MKKAYRILNLKYGEDLSQKGDLYIPNGNIKGTICRLGLAPIIDLVEIYNNKAGENAVQKLLQCTPSENIYRYKEASPIELLPFKKRTIILHGDRDEYLPIEITRKCSIKSNSYNNNLTLIEINDGSHMDFIDPNSKATKNVLAVLKNLTGK